MKKSDSEIQEGSVAPLIECIHKINYIFLVEGVAAYQVCGSSFHGGDTVTVYVFRTAGEVMFQVKHIVCSDENHKRVEKFTPGVRELVVTGRDCWCSDESTQSLCSVMMELEVLAVGEASTKSVPLILDWDSPVNVVADVEEPETLKSSIMMSLDEAQRQANRACNDAIRGLFSGDQQ
jgi:hypothetical protein